MICNLSIDHSFIVHYYWWMSETKHTSWRRQYDYAHRSNTIDHINWGDDRHCQFNLVLFAFSVWRLPCGTLWSLLAGARVPIVCKKYHWLHCYQLTGASAFDWWAHRSQFGRTLKSTGGQFKTNQTADRMISLFADLLPLASVSLSSKLVLFEILNFIIP